MLHYENLDISSIDGEIWKDIPNYLGKYQVSNLGRVKSMPRTFVYGRKYTQVVTMHEKIMRQTLDWNGYLNVYLLEETKKGKTKKIHRLVAMAFLENPNNYPIINHINAIKNDNRVENLEWTNFSGNMLHAMKLGRVKHKKGKDHPQSKTVYQYNLNGNLIETFDCISDAANKTGFSASHIGKNCQGLYDFYGQYVWSYSQKPIEYFQREFKKRLRKFNPVVKMDYDGNILDRYDSPRDAADATGLSRQNIDSTCRGKLKTCGGFKWKYAKNVEEEIFQFRVVYKDDDLQ